MTTKTAAQIHNEKMRALLDERIARGEAQAVARRQADDMGAWVPVRTEDDAWMGR